MLCSFLGTVLIVLFCSIAAFADNDDFCLPHEHDWEPECGICCEQYDEQKHKVTLGCEYPGCLETKIYYAAHVSYDDGPCTFVDQNRHAMQEVCEDCGYRGTYFEKHGPLSTTYKKLDRTYHSVSKKCLFCDSYLVKNKKEKHKNLTFKKKIVIATPAAAGKAQYYCRDCKAYVTKSVFWTRGGKGCRNYDVKMVSNISKRTRSVTITLNNALKDSKVKLVIDGKVYARKLKSSEKTVKFSITAPGKYSKNLKVRVVIYYKGKVIGGYKK